MHTYPMKKGSDYNHMIKISEFKLLKIQNTNFNIFSFKIF
jgi:hypothetical protein